ncbi:MAG TPA: S8 family serine peptidase, partial [Candidatus Limnocylindrales bacterium]|nr:S8 family serine peptidase [Candidatus Limnocylindrales bacterium]
SNAILDKTSAIVVLKQQPVATYDGHVPGYLKTRVSSAKLNPNSAAAKKYVGYLKTEHSAFAKWLQTNVPSAKITSQYFVTLNAVAVKLNGAAIGKLANNTDVAVVEYNALYHPDMSESYKLINAQAAWAAAGGRADAGAGVKVGMIDSGIDYRHPFFDPAGFAYPAGFPKCDAADMTGSTCKNVSEKVIVAKVYYNRNNQTDYDALPVAGEGDHGSHTAGTVAGVTGKTATVEGVAIDDMSGIAPGAWLGNYNVFPGAVVNARSEDILNAVEAAVIDGMDVLNLSLGGAYHGNNDLLAKGLDTAVAAGVVVVASAGNEGPGGFTIGSPGRARDIITVGASTNNHFVGQPLTYTGDSSATVGAAVGDFGSMPAGTFGLFDTAANGCAAIAAGASGKVALINRGVCTFSQKVANAKAAGATGVIVVNNVAGDPTAMARSVGFDDDIPAVMISNTAGAALRAAHATSVTVAATFSEFVTSNGDILAGFSSQGPTNVDYAIKPDLASVGVNVLSSVACTNGASCGGEGDWAFFSGTSMSAPHVAGSAAVLRGLHPTWTPAQIKSALVNTADLVVKNAFDASTTVGPQAQGAGREDLAEAASTDATFWPTSASFGRINASKTNATSIAVKVTNLTGTARTFDVAELKFTPAGGALAAFNGGTIGGDDSRITTPSSITVAANSSATLTITVNAGLANGTIAQGWIQLSGGGDEYQVAYWAQVAP